MATPPKINKWVLSPHAAQRIAERGIEVEELAEILHKPDFAIPQGPKWLLAKRFEYRDDNLIAAVVIEKEGAKSWIVLTVMVHFEVRRP